MLAGEGAEEAVAAARKAYGSSPESSKRLSNVDGGADGFDSVVGSNKKLQSQDGEGIETGVETGVDKAEGVEANVRWLEIGVEPDVGVDAEGVLASSADGGDVAMLGVPIAVGVPTEVKSELEVELVDGTAVPEGSRLARIPEAVGEVEDAPACRKLDGMGGGAMDEARANSGCCGCKTPSTYSRPVSDPSAIKTVPWASKLVPRNLFAASLP